MKEVELSEIATKVPTLNYDLSIVEALKIFAEYRIYDLLVVVKDRKPLGVVSKRDLLMAQHRAGPKGGRHNLFLAKGKNLQILLGQAGRAL
jgi:CBS domain-containing protein